MSEEKPGAGMITWIDLTVDDAERVRDFYGEVVGWTASPVRMGDYEDYTMCAPGTEHAVAGVCHARGANADLPPRWLLYVTVADLDHSVERVEALGGRVLRAVRSMPGQGRYCVIEDPAGAPIALFEPA